MIRSQAEYRGVVVRFLLEVGRLRLPAVTCALPLRRPLSLCSGDGRLFQGGVVRISWLVKNVYIASPLISNRPLFFPVPKTNGELFRRLACLRGCVGSQSVCAQAAWKVQPVEDCWQATGAEEHQQSLNRFALADQNATLLDQPSEYRLTIYRFVVIV